MADENIDIAPKVWLHSKDRYRPADIGAQLQHTRPQNGSVAIDNVPANLNLDNLDSLNGLSTAGGQGVYLTSVDDVTTNPAWLNGVTPDGSGKTKDAISAVIIVTDHGSGRVDAFYMYFYAYVGFRHMEHTINSFFHSCLDSTKEIKCSASKLGIISGTGKRS